MVSGDDSADSVISDIEAAISLINEGDTLAESGKREVAAARYLEAISQLKEIRQRSHGRVGKAVDELLRCANQRGRLLIDEQPVSNGRDIDAIIEEVGGREVPDSNERDIGGRDEAEQISREIRERIVEGNRLRSEGKYGEAVERYREARDIADQQLAGSSGKRLESEIDIYLRKSLSEKRRAVRQLGELDGIMRELDHELLARHGLGLPYRRAAADPETVDEADEIVYTPPLNPEIVDSTIAYYRELGSFERQLVSTAAETGGPTVVTERLGAVLEASHPDLLTNSGHNRGVVDAACDFLEAYESLVVQDDDDGLAELASRLDAVHSNVAAGEFEDAEALAARLNGLQTWASERLHRIELQSWRTDLRNQWPATAGEHLHLEVRVIDKLTGSDSGEPPLSQFESGLKRAERVVALAAAVEKVRDEYQAAVLDRLPKAFGRYLDAREISVTRLERLEATLEVVETACEAYHRYPSYPFDRVVGHLCEELETGTLDDQPDQLAELIESATDVLDFLGRVDTAHPSIQPDEWREDINTGLENVAPEVIQPLAALIDQMGEALWERQHLYQFSWRNFERLVASGFESQGYETQVTQATNDEGVDIWARADGNRIAIQVKQFDTGNRIGRPTLQKLASAIAKGDADQVIIVTSGEFAQSAREYADEFGPTMHLVDGRELIQMLTESNLPPPLSE